MIRNYVEVVKELAEWLMFFDIEKYNHQHDVYAVIDDDYVSLRVHNSICGTVHNAGNYIKVYTDKKHFETIFDFYDEQGIDAICEALNVEAYDITKAVADYVDCDFNDVNMNDIEFYVNNNVELLMMLYTYHEHFVYDHFAEYEENARYYIDKLLDEIEEE